MAIANRDSAKEATEEAARHAANAAALVTKAEAAVLSFGWLDDKIAATLAERIKAASTDLALPPD